MSLSDEALIELIQRQHLKFFWEFAHPVSGMARDRASSADDPGNDICTTGGTGMGAMAIIVGVERGWIARAAAVEHLLRLVKFLLDADHYHGVVPHFLNGATGRTIRFSRKDDGADLVETAFLVQGLLAVRQYCDGDSQSERALRGLIDQFWRDVEWDWHTRDGRSVLTWHWSPNHGWSMGHEIRGWNECLIVYLLAAASPTHPIAPAAYHFGFCQASEYRNNRDYFGIRLPLGPELGGPLFFAHYSFLGLDPRGLKDSHADYWAQNLAHARINYEHCVRNPGGFAGYGPNCWGLTASDDDRGYGAHAPDNDSGVISPTAALSSWPYVPEQALAAARHFYENLGDRIWGPYGFTDAFNEQVGWFGKTHLAIDQAPIVVMLENWRSGLLWRLFMTCPEIRTSLQRLGFSSPAIS